MDIHILVQLKRLKGFTVQTGREVSQRYYEKFEKIPETVEIQH